MAKFLNSRSSPSKLSNHREKPYGTAVHDLPVGSCFWTTEYPKEGRNYPCVIIRVSHGEAQKISKRPFDMRAGVRQLNGAVVACILFRFEDRPAIFCSFVHDLQVNDGVLKALSESGEYGMRFYEDQPNSIVECVQKTEPKFWKGLLSQYLIHSDGRGLPVVARNAEELWKSFPAVGKKNRKS